MLDRRTFLTGSAMTLGSAALYRSAETRGTRDNALEVSGYKYRLPRLRDGARLVFQGDSITDMNWGRDESDRNHYLGHSYVYLIASRLGVDLPATRLEFFNRGISGNGVADLKARWQKDAIDMKPDWLSILIGVNDVGRLLAGAAPRTWEDDYRFILEASRKANPDLTLVLLDPFVLPSGRLANPDEYRKWRGKIDLLAAVVQKLAADYKALHVKTQSIFDAAAKEAPPEHWIWDGVHPLPAGHELIARNWLQEASARRN